MRELFTMHRKWLFLIGIIILGVLVSTFWPKVVGFMYVLKHVVDFVGPLETVIYLAGVAFVGLAIFLFVRSYRREKSE